MPLDLLEEAYHEMTVGRSESTVCGVLGTRPEMFEGVLRAALEEALWERRRFKRA